MNFMLIVCLLLHQLLYKYDLIRLVLGDSYEAILLIRKLRLGEVKDVLEASPVSGAAGFKPVSSRSLSFYSYPAYFQCPISSGVKKRQRGVASL